MLVSNRQCRIRRTGMEKMEDDKLRTIDCLRGRLLAERVASRAAKEEADKMAKRLQELEGRLVEEIKYRDRAEKKLKFAIKRLESVKVSGGRDQMEMTLSSVSSSSSQHFLGHQIFDEMPASTNVEFDQSGLQKNVKRTKSSSGSEDIPGDDATVPSLEGSWSSTTIAKQCREVPKGVEEEDERLSPKEWALGELRACYSSSNRQKTSEKDSESEDNKLAIVPVSKPHDLEDGKPEIKDNIQGVLLALRNVKEQLLHSLRTRAADIYSPRDFFADHRDSHQQPFCCRASH